MKETLIMYNGKKENGDVAGFVFTLGDTPFGKPVILTKVFVIEKHRGHGHGRALMRAITNEADRETKDLILSVDPDPGMDFDRLVKFYESFGFTMMADGTSMYRKYVKLPKAAVYQDQL